MRREDIGRWKQDEVTQLLFKLLKNAQEVTRNELISFSPEIEALQNKYFYLQGKLEGINLTLEAELEDEDVNV